MSEVVRGWHFVGQNRLLAHQPELTVRAGYIYSEEGEIALCERGMHGSLHPFDALRYAPGPWLCLCEFSGKILYGDDKLVAEHRHVLKMVDLTKELRLFACWCVRNTPVGGGRTVWDLFQDERSKNAVRVAERFARGKARKTELAAARAAAWKADWDAAGAAARAAARDAARDAAWAAGGDAAGAAAGAAARDAAWAAAGDAAGAAAWAAAQAAAWAAAWEAQRARFLKVCEAAMRRAA